MDKHCGADKKVPSIDPILNKFSTYCIAVLDRMFFAWRVVLLLHYFTQAKWSVQKVCENDIISKVFENQIVIYLL